MSLRFLHSPAEAPAIIARFGQNAGQWQGTSYATVRDIAKAWIIFPR